MRLGAEDEDIAWAVDDRGLPVGPDHHVEAAPLRGGCSDRRVRAANLGHARWEDASRWTRANHGERTAGADIGAVGQVVDDGPVRTGAIHEDIRRANNAHTVVGRAAHGHREVAAIRVAGLVECAADHRGDTR